MGFWGFGVLGFWGRSRLPLGQVQRTGHGDFPIGPDFGDGTPRIEHEELGRAACRGHGEHVSRHRIRHTSTTAPTRRPSARCAIESWPRGLPCLRRSERRRLLFPSICQPCRVFLALRLELGELIAVHVLTGQQIVDFLGQFVVQPRPVPGLVGLHHVIGADDHIEGIP